MPRPKGSKNKVMATGNRRNQRLTRQQQEEVIQVYHTLGSRAATARKLGICDATVKRCLVLANNDPTLGAARAQALTQVAGKINGVANQILDSITPEELETRKHMVYDKDGLLKRIVTSGPSLKDKSISISALTAQQKVITETTAIINNPELLMGADRILSMPDSIDEARRLITMKVKKLRFMDVEFETGAAGQRINMALNRQHISEQEVEDAELVGEPFD